MSARLSDYPPPPSLGRLRDRAWMIGGAGALVTLAGYWLAPDRFFQAYLVAWLLWLGVALGCLALMMLHHLSRGAWGLVARRILEAASRTLPLLALLFVPLLLGLQSLYLWARPEAVAADELLQHKQAYLNPTAFTVRAVFFFAVWILFALVLSRLSLRQDRTGEAGLFRRMQAFAAPGLGIYALTATFASFDWLMSLEPHWYSSIFGVYFVGGHGISALAFLVPVALYLSRREPMSGVFKPLHFHDYGKLLLAFVMLWTYFALSQMLIIWSANLPEETVWYAARVTGSWKWVAVSLGAFHFALPFLLLLSRDLKRDAKKLAALGIFLLAMRWLDLYWLTSPAFHREGVTPHWLDVAAVVGIGGIWVGAFFAQLRKRSLLPLNDPYLEEALNRE